MENSTPQNETKQFKNITEILQLENLEDSNFLSIINAENNSFLLTDFLNLKNIKNLALTKEEVLSQLGKIKEISITINTNQEKYFYTFDHNTQIFIFNQMKNLQKSFSTPEKFAEEFGFGIKQIIRMKEIGNNNNSFLVVLNSSTNIKENQQKIISNKKIIDEKIDVKFMNSKYLLDKIKRTNGNGGNSYNNNYSNEIHNLKAKDSDYKKNYGKNSYNNSRHNSNASDLSWRKGSNADSMKENNPNYQQKKGSFVSDKKNSFYSNSGNYNSNSGGYKNDYKERERFNSDNVTDFNIKGKINPQKKGFHKNSFSSVNNLYFGKNNAEEVLSGLTALNTPINSATKNFSQEIEIDTSKIKYALQIKFKYSESDVKNIYEQMKQTKVLEKLPDFNHIKTEITRDQAKELNINFFTRKESISNYGNHRDRANTLQVPISAEEFKEKEKKKVKLNVDSPKFTAKQPPKNDTLTFNPLASMGAGGKNGFNKFDEFDPSAN